MNRFLSCISTLSHALSRISQCFSVLMLAGMVIVTFLQVIFRYILNDSLDWSEEGARYLFVWICYISMSYAMHSGSHLEVTVLRTRFGARTSKGMCLFSTGLTAVICFIIGMFGVDAVLKLYLTEQTTIALELYTWIVWMCLPVGFFLTAIQAVFRTILIAGNVVRCDDVDPDTLQAS